MIPYYPQPVWRIGSVEIHAFGAMAALAIVLGFALVRFLARARKLDEQRTGGLALAGLIAGLAMGVVAAQLASPGPVRLLTWRGESTVGFTMGALAVGAWHVWRSGTDGLRRLDVIALAFPVAWALVRTGCFFAHEHLGRASTSFLAVRFPEGARLDLGLLEALAACAVAPAMWLLARYRPPPGVLLAAILTAAALTRLAMHALS